MTSRKSQRQRKPRTIWEEKGAPSAASDPKLTKKAVRTIEKTVLKTVTTGSLLKITELDVVHLPELFTYKSLLNLQFQSFTIFIFNFFKLKFF